ncbi:MAG: aminotransferase class IV [Isosphaeraceae bacterium]
MRTLACLNGEIMPVDQAKVSVWDRGFLFGDSVYEMLRLYGGRGWIENLHLERLERSLAEMEFPAFDRTGLADRMARTIRQSEVQEGTAYIQITRGVAPRLHAFPDPPVPPTELIVIRPFDDGPTALLRESGVRVLSYPDLRWKRCDVKSTNLLGNVLANQAAHKAGCFEAVLVDEAGRVTEATHSSILWVRDGRVEGTPEGPGILPGTTRRLLLDLLREIGVPFAENHVDLDTLSGSDEVILVGTTIEVLPVVQVDDRHVGGGSPGPVTRSLQAAYRSAVQRWLDGDERAFGVRVGA